MENLDDDLVTFSSCDDATVTAKVKVKELVKAPSSPEPSPSSFVEEDAFDSTVMTTQVNQKKPTEKDPIQLDVKERNLVLMRKYQSQTEKQLKGFTDNLLKYQQKKDLHLILNVCLGLFITCLDLLKGVIPLLFSFLQILMNYYDKHENDLVPCISGLLLLIIGHEFFLLLMCYTSCQALNISHSDVKSMASRLYQASRDGVKLMFKHVDKKQQVIYI